MEIIESSFCRMDESSHRFFVLNGTDNEGVEVELTRTEWLIMKLLLENKGRLVKHIDLVNMIWGENAYIEYVEVNHDVIWHVSRIRGKLKSAGCLSKTPIDTIRSFGYRCKP